LRKAFPKLRIEAVTGDLHSDDRRTNVSAMAAAEQRLLVATDCLSEGINLQNLFDTVVHAAPATRRTGRSFRPARQAGALRAALFARQLD
jgi:superfamily II DNA/RNA helicase